MAQRAKRLQRDRERRAAENPSEREERLQRDRERWRERRAAEDPSEREERLQREREREEQTKVIPDTSRSSNLRFIPAISLQQHFLTSQIPATSTVHV